MPMHELAELKYADDAPGLRAEARRIYDMRYRKGEREVPEQYQAFVDLGPVVMLEKLLTLKKALQASRDLVHEKFLNGRGLPNTIAEWGGESNAYQDALSTLENTLQQQYSTKEKAMTPSPKWEVKLKPYDGFSMNTRTSEVGEAVGYRVSYRLKGSKGRYTQFVLQGNQPKDLQLLAEKHHQLCQRGKK